MSIRISKEKALSDIESYVKNFKSTNESGLSKDQVLKLLEDVKDEVDHIDTSRFIDITRPDNETITKLKKQNKELTVDRWDLISRIKSLESENKQIKKNCFFLTKKEQEKLSSWWEKHKSKTHPNGYFGANGGALTYHFTPTSIGIIKNVRCTCGEKICLTNKKDL